MKWTVDCPLGVELIFAFDLSNATLRLVMLLQILRLSSETPLFFSVECALFRSWATYSFSGGCLPRLETVHWCVVEDKDLLRQPIHYFCRLTLIV